MRESIQSLESTIRAALRLESERCESTPSGFEFRNGRCNTSPRLAYGRHRGPASDVARQAAVLIALYPSTDNDEIWVTLTRRPMTLSHHAGQVCLPGGRIEHGESAVEAAIREFKEELGVAPPSADPLGKMNPTYVFASDNVVTPIVVAGEAPATPWKPDPVEVDEVIEMPLTTVLPECSGVDRSDIGGPGGNPAEAMLPTAGWRLGKHAGISDCGEAIDYRFRYPAIAFTDASGHRREIWGATAMILERFGRLFIRAKEEANI
ncbi:MAG: CoA pyrophosphatase [Planctomycetota bacterium]